MITEALWHLSPTTSVIKEERLAKPIEQEVLLQGCYSLISTGTERLVAKGLVPNILHQTMTVPFMGEDFLFPIKYGYSLVAKSIGEKDRDSIYFHLLHPHQEKLVVPSTSLFTLPAAVPPKRAVLASNLETAVTAIWDSQVSIGDRVLVVGFGLIGSLVARLLSMMPRVEIVIAEKEAYRIELAQQMGFQTHSSRQDFDIAFHTSATSAGLQDCIDRVGQEGKIIELSWYGTQQSLLQLGGSFHHQRKQIISSQVSHIPADKTNRWDIQRRKELVFRLLENPIFEEHLTHEIPFQQTPLFFEQLRNNQLPKGLAWVVKY